MREKFCDWHIETAVFTSVSFAFLLQTDRAAMIDEIVDYVKFLRLQVKVNTQVIFSFLFSGF